MSKGFNFIKSNPLSALLVFALVIIAFFAGGKVLGNSKQIPIIQSIKQEMPEAKAKQDLNKEFLFSVKDDKGEEITKIKYVIQSVQLQDEILIKGQKARSLKGRTFLVVNLKIVNDFNKGIQINSKDYIRISMDGKNELFAPDIHSDPVKIQAISTKLTRLGMPIDEGAKNIVLQVGEIDGQKESIKLNLK